ncbi:MAG: hypothetical protein ACYCZX_16265 [Rhodospirillaceae bacterium]
MNRILNIVTPQPDHAFDDPRLGPVPRGALALAGIAVALLVAAWLATYFFFFLTRGPVG